MSLCPIGWQWVQWSNRRDLKAKQGAIRKDLDYLIPECGLSPWGNGEPLKDVFRCISSEQLFSFPRACIKVALEQLHPTFPPFLESYTHTHTHTQTHIPSHQVSSHLFRFHVRYHSFTSKITADDDCSHEIKRLLLLGRKAMTNQDSILKSRDITCQQSPSSQSYGFSSSHVWIWELDYKESWASRNWCFWTMVLEKTFESLLDYKEIQPVNPKGNQSWIFIGRTDAEVESAILWPPDVKNWLIEKDPDAGKDWRREEKGMTEDKMVGWHHWLNGHEFE